MRKTLKKSLSTVLSAALVLTMGGVGAVTNNTSAGAADDATYTATLGGQMDTTKATVGEWDASATASFKLGEEVTLTYDAGDKKGCWSGNYIGIDTDLTYTADITAVITSIKYDGVECDKADLSKITVGTENDSKTTLRITLSNAWGGVDSIFSEYQEFSKMEITFKISNAEDVTPGTTADYTATLGGQMDTTKATVGEWDASATVGFNLGEEATLVYDAGDEKACWSGNYIGIDTDLTWVEGMTAVITSLKYDGVECDKADLSKITVGTENDSKTTLRITLSNAWGGVDSIFSEYQEFSKMEITFKVTDAGDAPAEPTTPPATGDTVWSQAGAHAYISFQMATIWDYRDPYDAGKTAEDKGGHEFIKAGGEEFTFTSDKVKDALMEADGEYTLAITGCDMSASDLFNWLVISTDINRAEYPDVKVTNATVKIDGKVVEGLEGIELPYKSSENDKYYTFAIASAYDDWTLSNGGEAAYWGQGRALETTPEDSIEITYTISGLGSKVDNVAVGPKVGKKFTSGSFVYKVTKQAMTLSNGEAKVVGLSKAGKKAKSLTVANTVKKGATYAVTGIDKNAFKGAAAKAVTLGSKVKSIPASAFANCKNLSTLTLKAKLKSVSKNAFKGCTKKITVKGTAKKNNVKTLQKSGYKNFK